ncbi:unnamed protein product, partial [Ectocarpus sp. 6 AP-2014]
LIHCEAKSCRREAVKEMVKRGYIRIPLNSGLPLYHWLLAGYTKDDFCDVYACIEFIGDYLVEGFAQPWLVEQVEVCLRDYMKEALNAGTAFKMINVGYTGGGDILRHHDTVLAR